MYCFPQKKTHPNSGKLPECLKKSFKMNNFKYRINKSYLHKHNGAENKDVLFTCIEHTQVDLA